MKRLLAVIGATILGYLGWWLGEFVGIMTAMALSVVASAVGWYIGARLFDEYLS